MNFLWFYISRDQLDFWGGIIGATLGGVIGILAAFSAAWYATKKTAEQNNKKIQDIKDKELADKDQEKLNKYHRASLRAEVNLQDYIVSAFTNIRNLQGCVKHIQTHGIMANLPRSIDFDEKIMFDFRNQELLNKWLKLSMLTKQVNNLIDDFRIFYIRSTESVHILMLGMSTISKLEDHINSTVVKADYEVLSGFGTVCIQAIEQLIDNSMGMLALIDHHAKFPEDHFSNINEMNKYRVTLEDYERELSSVKERFNPDTMFTDLGSNFD